MWEGMRVKTGLELKSQSMVTPQKRNQDIVRLCTVVGLSQGEGTVALFFFAWLAMHKYKVQNKKILRTPAKYFIRFSRFSVPKIIFVS